MSKPRQKAGKTRLLTAFVLAIAVVATLLVLMSAGIWIYTSAMISREKALVTRVLPELDLAYELTVVSAGFQSGARMLRSAQSADELDRNRQEMDDVIVKTDAMIDAIGEFDTSLKTDLNREVTDVRQVLDGLAEVRVRQLTLADDIDTAAKRLLSRTRSLEKLIQRRIVSLTDEQLSRSAIVYELESEGIPDDGLANNLLDSLRLFESASLAVQDYLLLNQDLVALGAVIEQVPLLDTAESIVQARQRRELLINAMVSRIIYLENTATKNQVLQSITDLRNSLRSDGSIFNLRQSALVLESDQLALNELLEQYTGNILKHTEEVRDNARGTVTLVAYATLKGLAEYRNFLFIIAGISLIVLGWISYGLLYRKTVLPLVEINKQLEKVGSDVFMPNEKGYSIREMSDLSDAVAQLDKAQKNMRAKDRQLTASNSELLRLNENLEQFAHVASHDLQEPLRKLRQFSDLLVEDYEPILDGDGRFFLTAIKESAARMSFMIKDTLAYSRAGLNDQNIEPVDLQALIKALLQDMELAVEEANAIVQIQSLPTVLANSTGMDQLFRNLLINALKYRDPKRRVLVDVSASSDDSAQCLTIAVRDNGIGMPAKHLSRIFIPFERLQSGAVRGTGLGLAICAKVCHSHDWNIGVESEEGAGSCFNVRIPFSSIVEA